MSRDRMGNDVDGDAHIIYDYDHSLDDIHDRNGYLEVDYASDEFDAKHWRPHDVAPTRWQRWWWRRHWIVFAAAFLIPFVVLALVWLVADRYGDSAADAAPTAVVVSPSPVPTVLGAWPQDVPFVAHTVPAMIRDDITSVTAQRGYRFEGRAGEVWHISVEPEDTLDPQIRLYEPSGGELAYNDDRHTGDLSAGIQAILPADGVYRLLVESAPKSGGTTGTYWFTLFGG
jgi:hypothetical protein